MAREIVHNEYIDAKAQLHNKWLADADMLWRTSRARLVYPPFPPYPTEEVIVARAKVLLEFLSKQEQSEEPPVEKEQPMIEEPIIEKPLQEQQSLDVPLVDKHSQLSYTERIKELHGEELEEAVDKNLEEYSKLLVAERREEEIPSSTKLFPSLLKRIDEMKKSWG